VSYKIGILGGIGPATSAKFYHDIISDLQASGYIHSNTDYPHIILNSIPAPELTAECYSLDYIDPYIQGVNELAKHDPSFIVMSCNTIHLHLRLIKQQSGYNRILSIRDIVKAKLKKFQHKSVCVLATPSTVNSGLYDFAGVEYVKLPESMLLEVGEIIKQFSLSGDRVKCQQQLLNIVKYAEALGAETFLLACTEVSLLLADQPFEFIDTLQLLREYVCKRIFNYIRLKTQTTKIFSSKAA